MDKKQLQNWIKNDKFCEKVFQKGITEEEVKKAGKDKRVFIPKTPSTKNDVFFINKVFGKWKRNYIELEFKDDEFNMCPYIEDKDDLVWKFDTKITGKLIMTKSKFDNWRRASSKFDDSKPRPYEIEKNEDFEYGDWYDRDEILRRILKQKISVPVSFVKKRMIPISKIASHLEKKLESYNLNDEFQEIWRQITESLAHMGVTFYSFPGNDNEKYLWYEDFAMIPFIALNTTKFKQSLPWPAIPINVLLDIEEDDYESILRLLHQASLLRSINRYQNHKSYISLIDYRKADIPEESWIKYNYNKEDIRYGYWIDTYNNENCACVIDRIFKYIDDTCFYQNSQEKSLEENKRNYPKEQESIENNFVKWYGEWGEYMLKAIKAKTIELGISWPPHDLATQMKLCMYFPNCVNLTFFSSLLLKITYPLFYFPEDNVLKVVPQKFKSFFLISIKSFKSAFIENPYI